MARKLNPAYADGYACPQCGGVMARCAQVTTINGHKIADDDVIHDVRVTSGTAWRRWEHTVTHRCPTCGISLSPAQMEKLAMLPDELPDDYWIEDETLDFEQAAAAARAGMEILASEGPDRDRARQDFEEMMKDIQEEKRNRC